MNVETLVYRLLNTNPELISLLQGMRKQTLENEETGVWKHDIPEVYQKKELAPFIRINPIYEGEFGFSDDESMSEEQRVQISFWTKNDNDAYRIKEKIDEILKENNFTRYTANENPRYKDTDIDLLINHRKYRFFDWKK